MYSVSIKRDGEEIMKSGRKTTRLLAIEDACSFILECTDHNVSLKVVKTSTGIEVFTKQTKLKRTKIDYGSYKSVVLIPWHYYQLLYTVSFIDT